MYTYLQLAGNVAIERLLDEQVAKRRSVLLAAVRQLDGQVHDAADVGPEERDLGGGGGPVSYLSLVTRHIRIHVVTHMHTSIPW